MQGRPLLQRRPVRPAPARPGATGRRRGVASSAGTPVRWTRRATECRRHRQRTRRLWDRRKRTHMRQSRRPDRRSCRRWACSAPGGLELLGLQANGRTPGPLRRSGPPSARAALQRIGGRVAPRTLVEVMDPTCRRRDGSDLASAAVPEHLVPDQRSGPGERPRQLESSTATAGWMRPRSAGPAAVRPIAVSPRSRARPPATATG